MKYILLNTILLVTSFSFSQEIKTINGLISNPETHVLYRDYQNVLEFITCANCDSSFVTSMNATITPINDFAFNVLVKEGVRKVTLTVNCFKAQDTTVLFNEIYSAIALPKPTLYLGGIDLSKKLNNIDDNTILTHQFFLLDMMEALELSMPSLKL